jgi:glycosyltransferase involved in cell wall biosynthesis
MDSGNPKIAEFAATLANPARVHALGERRDIDRVMPAFDLLLSTSSRAEAFPNVIGEAMACGVPAITTDVGDSGWIVDDPSRVVSPRDPAALAAQAIRVLALSEQGRIRLGHADRTRIETHFGMPTISNQYLVLWRNAEASARRQRPTDRAA